MMGTSDDTSAELTADESWFFADFVAERRTAESPQHRVTISKPFYMSQHEVTIGQFQEFVTETVTQPRLKIRAGGLRLAARRVAGGAYIPLAESWLQADRPAPGVQCEF